MSTPPAEEALHPESGVRPISRGLFVAVQVLMWIWAGLAGAVLVLLYLASHAYGEWAHVAGYHDADELHLYDERAARAAVTYFLMLMVLLAALVCLVVWMNRTHKYESHYGPLGRQWTSGWTVGGWFIPIGGLVIPAMVLAEIQKVASAIRSGDPSAWRSQRVSPLGVVWWICFVVGWWGPWLASLIDPTTFELSAQQHYLIASCITTGVFAAAGAMGALYVRQIASHLDAGPPPLPRAAVPVRDAAGTAETRSRGPRGLARGMLGGVAVVAIVAILMTVLRMGDDRTSRPVSQSVLPIATDFDIVASGELCNADDCLGSYVAIVPKDDASNHNAALSDLREALVSNGWQDGGPDATGHALFWSSDGSILANVEHLDHPSHDDGDTGDLTKEQRRRGLYISLYDFRYGD